jgi:hypothetical protein
MNSTKEDIDSYIGTALSLLNTPSVPMNKAYIFLKIQAKYSLTKLLGKTINNYNVILDTI